MYLWLAMALSQLFSSCFLVLWLEGVRAIKMPLPLLLHRLHRENWEMELAGFGSSHVCYSSSSGATWKLNWTVRWPTEIARKSSKIRIPDQVQVKPRSFPGRMALPLPRVHQSPTGLFFFLFFFFLISDDQIWLVSSQWTSASGVSNLFVSVWQYKFI